MMILSYFIMAYRHLVNFPVYTIINVFGLAIGITIAILLSLLGRYELSYDDIFNHEGDIYRITREFTKSDIHLATLAPRFSQEIDNYFPEIDSITRVTRHGWRLKAGDTFFANTGVSLVDRNFFEFFPMDFIEGDPQHAFNDPRGLILTESSSLRFFGSLNAMGRTMTFENGVQLTVRGIIRDLPENTHLTFGALAQVELEALFDPNYLEGWSDNSWHTYVKLTNPKVAAKLEAEFPKFLNHVVAPTAANWTALHLQKLKAIHLTDALDGEQKPGTSYFAVYAQFSIAIIVLLIACVNYMNLSTAHGMRRTKEIAMRKVAGAVRSRVVLQFFIETMTITAIALLIAMSLVEAILPLFSWFVERQLTFNYFSNGFLATSLLILWGGVSLFSGSYTAIYLSRFRPANILSGEIVAGKGVAIFRRLLIVAQYTMSAFICICTVVVLQQMHFISSVDLGYEKGDKVILEYYFVKGEEGDFRLIQEKLLAHDTICSVNRGSHLPSSNLTNSMSARVLGFSGSSISVRNLDVDFKFLTHYDMKIIAGRDFDESFGDYYLGDNSQNPSKGFSIVSQSAAKMFGFSADDILDKEIRSGDQTFTVVGVVADTYYSTLYKPQRALFFRLVNGHDNDISIQIDIKKRAEALNHIESVWNQVVPHREMIRYFLSDTFKWRYRQAYQQSIIFSVFSFLAICVACIGLYGLTLFFIQQKTKEIGVRKAMGASVMDIILLLVRGFATLILLANVIAWPLAYFTMEQWLAKFAYAIDLEVFPFVISAFILLVISMLTVVAQGARTALSRPSRALRYE